MQRGENTIDRVEHHSHVVQEKIEGTSGVRNIADGVDGTAQSSAEWSSRLMHQKNSQQRGARFFSELQFWRDYYDGSGNSVATEKTDKYAVCISTHVFEMLKVLGA